MWDLSSPTRDWTCIPCSGSAVLTTGQPGILCDSLCTSCYLRSFSFSFLFFFFFPLIYFDVQGLLSPSPSQIVITSLGIWRAVHQSSSLPSHHHSAFSCGIFRMTQIFFFSWGKVSLTTKISFIPDLKFCFTIATRTRILWLLNYRPVMSNHDLRKRKFHILPGHYQ